MSSEIGRTIPANSSIHAKRERPRSRRDSQVPVRACAYPSESPSSCASSFPDLLSVDTTIVPRAGVSAHSAGLIVTGVVAVAPGATLRKSPCEIAGVHGLNFAEPSTTSTELLSRSKPNAWYVNPGLDVFDRHGSPVRQSRLDRIGSSSVIPSVGAGARKVMPAPAPPVLNTQDPTPPF